MQPATRGWCIGREAGREKKRGDGKRAVERREMGREMGTGRAKRTT